MSTQARLCVGNSCYFVALIGLLVVAGGCAKNKTAQSAPPPEAVATDPSIVTGSISSPSQAGQQSIPQKNPGTVTPLKTKPLTTSATAVATRTTRNKISLAFPKQGYALSGDQSAQLATFVQEAKKNKKRVKVIGIATSNKGAKNKGAREKARLEASRRAKAASLFLRVHGIETDDMTITTADARPRKGVSPRRVEVVFQ